MNDVQFSGQHMVTRDVNASLRAKIEGMEVYMRAQEQVPIPVKHMFSQGLYAREVTIPAGTIVTGKIHKYEQLNILSKGDISVLTQDGPIRVQAPFSIVSPPGTKRIVFAHSECVWTTIHGTDCIDVDKIEQTFIAQSDAEYLQHLDALLLLEDKS